MQSDDDSGVSPPKQYRPNELEPIFVVGEEIVETEDDPIEDIRRLFEPPQVATPQAQGARPRHAAGNKYKEIYGDSTDDSSEDSQSIVSDDGERDIHNVKEILIVSDIDTDDECDEEEEIVDTDTSDNSSGLDFYGAYEPEPDIQQIKDILIADEVDSDSDSEFLDENLPDGWEISYPPGGAPLYYHVPSGRVTTVRPRLARKSRRDTGSMGY